MSWPITTLGTGLDSLVRSTTTSLLPIFLLYPQIAWLAVYKETDNPKGGSTGVGLDFVGEIRLTPQSFNARHY